MVRANEELRDYAKKNGVFLWQIGEKIHLRDGNFSRKLRTELTPRERNKLIAIVDLIAVEQRRAEGYDT